jgi:hypothetical protein
VQRFLREKRENKIEIIEKREKDQRFLREKRKNGIKITEKREKDDSP